MERSFSIMELSQIPFSMNNLCVYRKVMEDPALENLYQCVFNLFFCQHTGQQIAAIKAYSSFCSVLYESEYSGNLADYLFALALYDENPFSLLCANNQFQNCPQNIKRAATHDLNLLYQISTITDSQLKSVFQQTFSNNKDLIDALPSYSVSHQHFSAKGMWGENLESFADFYRNHGVGVYAKYFAFTYRTKITPVPNPDPISFSDLKQYQSQQQQIRENTIAFLKEKSYHHVLLYGDRGTGKSSTVKAVINEYHNNGLRLIELAKDSLSDLPVLMQKLERLPLKFLIFIDDVSLHEDDPELSLFKASLEGSIRSQANNIAIYITSNRRHLVKETFSARDGNDVHNHDTLDETVSLSDRFGLKVTFLQPSKSEYIELVQGLAKEARIPYDDVQLAQQAEQFALLRGSRSPRVAHQFLCTICNQKNPLPSSESNGL